VRLAPINRGQSCFRVIVIDQLIEPDHPARAIEAFVRQLDLSAFEAPLRAREGIAGRTPFDPHLLVCLWIYAYSRSIHSAREIARRCEYEPAFQWLTALRSINPHTLSDFRVAHQKALDALFAQSLAVLRAEGLVTYERIAHDGTKVRADAGVDSYRRASTVREHLEAARAHVAAVNQAREQAASARQYAAQQRAARERVARLERAVAQFEALQAPEPVPPSSAPAAPDPASPAPTEGVAPVDPPEAPAPTPAPARETSAVASEPPAPPAKAPAPAKPAERRVSLTEPSVPIMKQSDGGYAPAYNVQISTDAAGGFIAEAHVTVAPNDQGELPAAVDRLVARSGRVPGQMLVDGGYVQRPVIEAMAQAGVDLIGPLPDTRGAALTSLRRRGVSEAFYPQAFTYDPQQDVYTCPAGQLLRHAGVRQRRGLTVHTYRATRACCQACPYKPRCCGSTTSTGRSITRNVEPPAVQAFRQKMATPAAQALLRTRGALAEFTNAWLKAKIGLRRFHVRGAQAVQCEVLWAALAYNLMRRRTHPQSVARTAREALAG